ncbi:MAG: hypothetical protein FWC68_02340 [Oscillospiraceae bacterium]|nr:hypothetical protein [Oscillospiraceae bacterium]
MGNEEINVGVENETLKGVAKVAKSINELVNPYDIGIGEMPEEIPTEGINPIGEEFKVCKTNLPEKTGLWTKVRNVLFYEIKVELTPYQQKVEDDINNFLHQEVTFKKVKDFLFQEITFGKKKNA